MADRGRRRLEDRQRLGGAAWLDEDRIVIGGLGEDEEETVPTHHDALAGHLLALDPARGAIRRWPTSGSRR
ncbi:hypothetical protein ACFXPT_23810 [Streptomyces goshikiensis]|uniref:hypothetical protein n=1 Tax=Streptomyces goshikiensis TaxID=1942 RepID=UPI003694D53F